MLVGAEGAALAQHLVDERGFAMVDVGDNGDIANVFHSHSNLLHKYKKR